MSATNRGSVRRPDDYYATPAWCVRALLKTVQLPGGNWFEPAVGDGAIVRAVNECRRDVKWQVNDIDLSRFANSDYYTATERSYSEFWTGWRNWADVVITNPPFSQALEFVQGGLKDGRIVIMLLRLNWLASQKRNPFLRENTPSVYILPRRPSFTGTGTDATDYAWMVWGMGAPTVHVIDLEVCR